MVALRWDVVQSLVRRTNLVKVGEEDVPSELNLTLFRVIEGKHPKL